MTTLNPLRYVANRKGEPVMKRLFSIVITLAVIGSAVGVAMAGRTTVELKSADVSVRQSEEESNGDYFLMSVDVPDGVSSATLLGAILEFALDVDARADTVAVVDQDTSYAVIHWSPVPLVEVYALNSATGSALDSLRWNRDMSFPVPVALGTGKVVRINITRLVKHLLANPEENHGLVIGSLSGRRNGVFSLHQRFGPGVLARIRYVY